MLGENDEEKQVYTVALDSDCNLLYNTCIHCYSKGNDMKLYKILETDGSVIRIFSYKEEAEKFLSLDRTLRIETIKVFKQKLKDNVYIKAYTVLGDSIL
jgi:hypothetical protein